MYTQTDFKTKTALKQAIKDKKPLRYFQPGFGFGNEILDGTVYLEGPHYPAPHTWYAKATVANGYIVKVS